jgi:hypothetical protein
MMCLGLKNMALERFNMLMNSPQLPSHHFSIRPGGSSAAGHYDPSGGGGHYDLRGGHSEPDGLLGRGQRDQRSPMKVTNFDPGQDYKTLLRQHSSSRLFEVGITFDYFTELIFSLISGFIKYRYGIPRWFLPGTVLCFLFQYRYRPIFCITKTT